MQTHVKKNSFIVVALLLVCQLGFAQDDSTPAPAPKAKAKPAAAAAAVAAPAAPAPAPANATEIDSSTSTALDYLFNHKAGQGTTMKAGNDVASVLVDKIKAVDALKTPGLDNPQLRARFETYLSLKEVSQDRINEYFTKMVSVTTLLKQGDSFGAWKTLYSLGDYQDLDAGLSRELAARVESFWNTNRTKNGLEIANNQLRDNIQKYNHNADLDANDLQKEAAMTPQNNTNKGKSTSSASSTGVSASNTTNSPLNSPDADPVAAEAAILPAMGNALMGKMELTGEYLNFLEARAKIKLNEIKANKMSDMDREAFADYIRTLYRGHRYYHVVIAADFYRALFNEGDYPQDLANAAVAAAGANAKQAADSAHLTVKSLGLNASGPASALNQLGGAAGGQNGQDDQPVSIADEVTSALEINNRVNQAVEVVRYKADKGEIAAAADQLQQAFLANEFHPMLQSLPRVEKEKVGEYLGKLEVLRHQLEVRGFEQVDGQVADIKKIATDFDATEPLALVNGIKLEARLRLGKARLLAQSGQLDEAMKEFTTAAEEWPGNPDVTTSSNLFFKSQDNANQATVDFDRMVQDQNYRGMFDRQLEFALAVKGDATREQQLKDALTKVGKAKIAEEKANMLVMNGDVNGAWETIELAAKDWPDDAKLNKLLASLSGRGADFVSALNKARDAEAKKELGYSLTWYVNAQGFYPASVIANEGIDRVRKQILTPAAVEAN
jgi:hypothetical protein